MIKKVQSAYKVEGIKNLGCNGIKDILRLTQKSTGQHKTFNIGTDAWRILYYTQFRKNAENCSDVSPEMPYDVQQDIAHFVWENFTLE